MRNFPLFYLLFLLFGLSPCFLSAQWTKTNGLPGGTTSSFLRFGDTVLVNCNRLYFSTNDGQSWTPLSGTNQPNIHQMATDGINLYGRGYQNGLNKMVCRSADFGQTWASTLVPDSLYFYDFFTWSGFLYGADYQGIYRSADQGVHWEFTTTQPVSSLQLEGQRMVGNRLNCIVESLDGGFTWDTLLQFNNNVIDILQHENYLSVFMQDASGGCWSSSDYGQTWQHFSGIAFNQFTAFVWHEGTIFGLKSTKVYKSDDLGDTWVEIAPPQGLIYAIAGISSGSSILIGGLDKGVFRSNDHGDSWSAANQGLIAGEPTQFNITPQGLFAPGVGDIYRLQPDGINWTGMHYNITLPWYSYRYTAFLQAGNYLIAGANNESCWVSVDSGQTWVESFIANGGFSSGYFTPLGLVGNKVIGVIDDFDWVSMYVSDNNGLTFQPLTSLSTQFNTSSQTVDLDAGQIYTMATDNHIYTSNNGENWSLLSSNVPVDSLSIWGYDRRLFVRGNSIWVFDNVSPTSKLAFSTDLGQHWTVYDLGTAGFNWGTTVFNDLKSVGNYLVASTNRGIFRSADGGLHWDAWGEGLIIPFAIDLQVYDGYLWTGISGDGIWKRPISELGLQTVTGTVFQDTNSNGQQDIGEPGLPNIIVQSLTSNTYANTRADGTFTLLSSLAQEQLQVHLPAPYWTANPGGSQTVSLPATGVNFALSLYPGAHDLSVALTNVAALRPGFETTYVLTWRNEVPVPVSDVAIELAYPSDQLEFVSAIPAPTSPTAGLLQWQPGEVGPNAVGLIQLLFKVPANVALNTEICATATAKPLDSDFFPANNTRERCAIVVGSFDPNDKQAEPATQLTPNEIAAQEPVVYTVRFQNTGNFPASFVRIDDTLSTYFDPATFRLLSSSHPCTWTLRHAGELEFDFPNIQLPPVTTDEPGSHGFVQYSVQARSNLALGTPLRNTAHIFFDYNSPITTNTTETVVSLLNPVHSADIDLVMNVFPNPAADFARLDLPEAGLLTITDALGRLMWQSQTSAGVTELDVRAWPTGTYRLRFNNGEKQGDGVLVVQR